MQHVWGRGTVLTEFGLGKPRERDTFEDPGVDGRIIVRRVLRMWNGGMGWIVLAQDRDRWRALVNAVMHLRVP